MARNTSKNPSFTSPSQPSPYTLRIRDVPALSGSRQSALASADRILHFAWTLAPSGACVRCESQWARPAFAAMPHAALPDVSGYATLSKPSWTVLVVDDDAGVRQSLRLCLEAAGARVLGV